ncbi:VPLPA-CTERM sorting domain-containing protein [Pararhodobacter sp. SW119]|uniref:VPLPA-CTERM sorting domain-containing protein n=1 Tax=Pararhodobacter sp. SW119 TaxID=2780075 RepID=UPI001ADF151D|nr:VPLPA-CTERM sorting domain-containing protein [Pararhodobacter sp. SW119]
MKYLRLIVVAGAMALSGAANASTYIAQFATVTNAGVFTLTAEQANLLGAPTADRIGQIRIRSGAAGDTFDADSIFASVTSNGGAILGLRNGSASALSYSGDEFEALGLTTLLQDFNNDDRFDFDPGVYLLFNSSSSNIVFAGSATFGGSQTRGEFTALAPIPLPAAGWLLLAAFGGLGVAARRKARANA